MPSTAPTHTYVLHDLDHTELGRYSSRGGSAAARKATTRLLRERSTESCQFFLRKAGQKALTRWEGRRDELHTPKVVERNGRTLTFKTASKARRVAGAGAVLGKCPTSPLAPQEEEEDAQEEEEVQEE